ncbi:MAG: adenosine deaminase, partial [Actinomycetes bacterium]
MTFVEGLPKAELHVHHVGSASIMTVAELAARHEGSTSVPSDPDQLTDYYDFTDFGHFIEVYLSVVDLLRTPEDIWTLTHDVAHDLAAQNVRYAELTVTPYTSIRAGIAAEAFCEAVEDARRTAEAELDLTLRWCFDIPGEFGLEGADATIDVALSQQPDGLVSFGQGGPEDGVPRPQFAPHFAQAQAAGLHSVPHAGESTGPETIWDSLRHLGAQRPGPADR